MARSLTEIAALLDDWQDFLLEFTGGFVEPDKVGDAKAEIYDSNGNPINLREIAKELRAIDANSKL